MISETELAEYFMNFTSSAFRLETLDVYRVDDETEYFERFMAGGEFPEDWHDNPWVRSITESGRKLHRVHVLRTPLSDYLRFQLGWGYPGNVHDGEDIGIIDLSEREISGLPDHDFWLFDEVDVLRMYYADDGTFEGAEHLSPSRAPEYIAYRDFALSTATPYTEFWSRYQKRVE
ncbi:hypothetical protein GCM10009799_10180 [Nocardiopsis rhodophaea]|uniref:DUF6879 domain-containing protein n=1 Tax=Nocardiopsis rhodophaea TaxID=280238 RepID=A0ABN2SIC7_9ACTN